MSSGAAGAQYMRGATTCAWRCALSCARCACSWGLLESACCSSCCDAIVEVPCPAAPAARRCCANVPVEAPVQGYEEKDDPPLGTVLVTANSTGCFQAVAYRCMGD